MYNTNAKKYDESIKRYPAKSNDILLAKKVRLAQSLKKQHKLNC